ncbi:hypothetical protein F442_13720 [Phytophthora nicotianae P10297]|uniref:Uncharacterized protein n=1 Tax=Phytophthora nicotianae P10297 TaxID=1317064 RepID=W2YVD3_PHYNI|nr:hypothetical protein F442_13720 [Phytophthora nicotianae P10297]
MDCKVEDDVEVETIMAPSEAKPFEFMGVTRYVVHRGCFHRPHEYVLVAATGEVFTSCGEHLGYQICQFVSISQWPVTSTATRKRMIRAQVLRELPDGSVGVYYKIIVDSKPFVPDSVVQISLWHDVQNFWKMVPRCADAKKLCYCVEHKDVLNLSLLRSSCGCGDPLTCGLCGSPLRSRSLGDIASSLGAMWDGISQAYRCTICSILLCLKTRCCSMRQLARIDRDTMETDRQIVVICTTCADYVRSENALEIARRGIHEICATFKDKKPPYAGSCRTHHNIRT